MATVGESLPEMINQITNLILVTRGPDREELQKQQVLLSKKLQKLIDKNVPQDTVEYNELVSKIQEANSEIKASLDDLENVAKTIETIGMVLGRLSQLADMVT